METVKRGSKSRVDVEEEDDADVCLKFSQQSSVGVAPEDKKLVNAYEVYKTSPETRALKSESNKKLCADALINPLGLGPLTYLSAKALSKRFAPHELPPMFASDPLIVRAYYDALDIDLPLDKCYYIDDELYWFRYVSTKHKDKSLQTKKLNWKNLGITMKFENYLQQLPAEHYNDAEMRALADKIQQFVTNLHIEHLQSVNETTLLRRLKEDRLDSTSSSGMTPSISSTSSIEEEVHGEEEDMGEGSEKTPPYQINRGASFTSVVTTWSYRLRSINVQGPWYEQHKTVDSKEIRRDKKRVQRAKRLRRADRKEERARKEEQEELQRELDEREAEEKAIADRIAKRKEARRRRRKGDDTYSIFDIDIEPPSEELLFKDVSDARNPEKLKKRLDQMRSADFGEYCHHVDLRLVRYFPHLSELYVEFNGPPPPVKYEKWHFDFSTRDIERLGRALLSLEHLKIFKLRNSRMSAKKLYLLTKNLKYIYTLQSVDFSYDNLKDDCGDGLYELFQKTTSIKSLELAGNELGKAAIGELAMALGSYEGVCQYLGLGGNPLDYIALISLSSYIMNTNQVRELCLRGAMVTPKAIKSVIAQQLIRHHSSLRGLDLSAISIDYDAACELLSALIKNHKIRKLDVRSCHIPAELELEFEILIKRNKFLFSYPAIGDTRKSIDFIDESIAKMKNKILLNAIEEVEIKAQCMRNRPVEFHHNFELERLRKEEEMAKNADEPSEFGEEEGEEEQEQSTSYYHPIFYEDPNSFDKEEIKKRFWFFEPPRKISNVTVAPLSSV